MRKLAALPLSIIAILALVAFWWASGRGDASAAPPAGAAIDSSRPAQEPVRSAPSGAPAAAMDAGVAQAEEEKDTASITFVTVPSSNATVTWGRQLLGRIRPGKSLTVVRPRDSGPLDVIVRAAGYLPVQTRAHTFSDARVLVRLTKPEEKSELLGYRIPLDAGLDPEAGLPEGGYPEGGVQGSWDAGVSPLMPAAPLAP